MKNTFCGPEKKIEYQLVSTNRLAVIAANVGLKRCMEETMNSFPEVVWDRFTERAGGITAFGWIDREDALKDFMVILIDDEGEDYNIRFVTSSARFSREFSKRSGGSIHIACQHVNGVFNVRTLRADAAARASLPDGGRTSP